MKFREFFLAMLLGWGGATGAQASTMELREATAAITIDDTTTQSVVTLPYNWDRLHGGKPGTGIFEVAFSLPEQPVIPFAVYFLRLGNAYEVWLNGALLERNGDLNKFNGGDYAKVPRYLTIPPQLLQKDNLFRIHIKADSGRHGGVPRLLVGPDHEVSPVYDVEYRWRVEGSLAVVIFSSLVGAMALALWLTQSRPDSLAANRLTLFNRDNLYFFASLAEFSWALRVGDVLIERPVLPWPWWGVVTVMALATWVCSLLLFSLAVAVAEWTGRRWAPAAVRCLWVLWVGGAVSSIWSLTLQNLLPLTLWYASTTVVCLPFAIYSTWVAMRRATIAHRVVTFAILLNVGFGLRDWLVFRVSNSFGGNTLTRYSSVVFGLALAYIVIARFHHASGQVRDFVTNMAAKVSEKEQALEASYRQLEQLAREQVRSSERTRILRDMHDGVGSHISSALRQLQSGKVNHEEVMRTLRDSLDQLKLSIDAMNLPPGDITALLANLRYRLEPRLLASDIELTWDVDLLDPVGRFDDDGMRQLQFMVFEALSNVLQHAQASMLRIQAKREGEGVQLRIIDNGRGFDAQTSHRNGLLSMKERAVAIGAALTITSEPGQTVVEIGLA